MTIAFGIVSVIAFGYALWQKRAVDSVRRLSERMTANIRSIAQNIADANVNTPSEGYARSIVRICDGLLSRTSDVPMIGAVLIYYQAIQIPPLQTGCGELVEDPDARYGRSLRGQASSSDGRRDVLLHGPYERLPVTGIYKAGFHLKVETPAADVPSESFVASLDVFNYQGRGVLAERQITLGECGARYQYFEFQFTYPDPQMTLEYRIKLHRTDVAVFVDRVRLERISD